ncbi:MAG: 1-(5-phosphoribosyl)-5-[Oscillospiraceae bacterium]|nr:1-(5-phosphoribosyl)-5-[(5-phosphoribosylamino)methylideneamino]imidazole-4-carboxamide isomerase [Oscillospiraceae bacterium]
MKIYPPIDLRGGKVVRLLQGDYGKMEQYEIVPVDAALSFEKLGAKNLHVVDLDGAKDGALSNFDTIRSIVGSTGMFVEVGGGIRDEERIEKYLSMGAGRVILGTAAVNNPDFLRRAVSRYGESIAVGVDAKNGFVATDGWLNVTELDGVDFCRRMRDLGVKTVIYTDISKDGALQGTNLEIYGVLSGIEGLDVVASGGISFLHEIETLRSMGIHGAIVGKAIYSGKLELSEVIAAAGSKEE